MLKREIRETSDGSKTIYLPDWNESYHSRHGAVQEALHVFIQYGLQNFSSFSTVHILEYGFGTGLNALLTLIHSEKNDQEIYYTTLEKFPVTFSEADVMEFEQSVAGVHTDSDKNKIKEYFQSLHNSEWSKESEISDLFYLNKIQTDFREYTSEPESFDLVYFDAFGIRVQPELWDKSIFEKIFSGLKSGGLITTYACNSQLKRSLLETGFKVEKIPGPPGKREMTNAWKP